MHFALCWALTSDAIMLLLSPFASSYASPALKSDPAAYAGQYCPKEYEQCMQDFTCLSGNKRIESQVGRRRLGAAELHIGGPAGLVANMYQLPGL